MHPLLTPALLTNIFVCVSFGWNIAKLGYLQQVLTSIGTYPTHVHILLVTDKVSQLRTVVDEWQLGIPFRHSIRIKGPHSASYANDTAQYKLLWEHKKYVEEAYNLGTYTTYIYIEDDTFITWANLVSWAFDTEVLEPMGFMRGFYRTEVNSTTGKKVMMDVWQNFELDKWDRKLELEATNGSFICPARLHSWPTVSVRRGSSGPKHRHNRTCLVHSHFLQLPTPFMGMWIATHKQLGEFIASGPWKKEVALETPITNLDTMGYPERTTIFAQLANVPKGFASASVVPYENTTRVLAEVAGISHLRNGYSGLGLLISSIPVAEYMI